MRLGLFDRMRGRGRDGEDSFNAEDEGPVSKAYRNMMLLYAVVILVFVLAMTGAVVLGMKGNVAFAVSSILPIVVCIGAVIAMLALTRRNAEDIRREARLEMLEEELDSYLDQYSKALKASEEISKTRHDLRNQVQIIDYLAQSGEYDEALRMQQRLSQQTGEFIQELDDASDV